MSYMTIDGFENLTPQQCFDMTVDHLFKTKRKSIRQDSNSQACLYTGSGCAAAPFLAKETIEDVDNSTWDLLVRDGIVPSTHEYLIYSLQQCHDLTTATEGREFLMELTDSLMNTADRFHLNTENLKAKLAQLTS